MEIIKTTKTVTIWGTSNAWSLEPQKGLSEASTESRTELEIQGDEKNGYNLVMSPEGFFSADYWYKTKEEAIESAEELFNVTRSEWT
jgi:hypothetical protein